MNRFLPEVPNASVPAEDMSWLLLASVRYSLGRRSYAPSLTADLVREYRRMLTPAQRTQIAEEIRHALRMDKYGPGTQDIGATWTRLANDLDPPTGCETV